MRTRSVWLVLLWAAAVAAVRADYVEVRRPVAVRVEPSRDADVVFQAQTGAQLTLLDSDTQNNYYHVEDTSTGQDGWIYRTFVRRHPGAVPPASGGSSFTSGRGVPAGGGFPTKRCKLPYNEEASGETGFDHSCGLTGNAERDSGEFVQNISKNDLCETASAQGITISDLEKLQKLVDDTGLVYGSKFTGKGPPKDRSILGALPPIDSGPKLEEGDVVSFVGFLVDAHYMPQSESKPKNGKGGESVNCNQTEHAKADIHLALGETKGRIAARDPNKAEKLCHTTSAEMIPHLRPGVWNVDNLNQVIDLERPVLITGHLFFDGSHEACKNGKPHGSDPRRVTVWEIHPVYEFKVCKFDSINQCDPGKESVWEPMSKAGGIALEKEIANE